MRCQVSFSLTVQPTVDAFTLYASVCFIYKCYRISTESVYRIPGFVLGYNGVLIRSQETLLSNVFIFAIRFLLMH